MKSKAEQSAREGHTELSVGQKKESEEERKVRKKEIKMCHMLVMLSLSVLVVVSMSFVPSIKKDSPLFLVMCCPVAPVCSSPSLFVLCPLLRSPIKRKKERQTDRKKERRKKERKTDSQTDRQIDRQTDRQTETSDRDRQKDRKKKDRQTDRPRCSGADVNSSRRAVGFDFLRDEHSLAEEVITGHVGYADHTAHHRT